MSSEEKSYPAQPGYIHELLDAVPAGIIVTHTDGRISYINAEAERLFGYVRDELINQNIKLLLRGDFDINQLQSFQLGSVQTEFLQNSAGQASARYAGISQDVYGRRKDQGEFPVEIGLRPLTAEGEQLIVATIVDITRRKQWEARFAKVIEASPYGKLLVDEQGIIQMANPSLLALFGYTSEELLGKSMDILLPERYRDHHKKLREGYTERPSLRPMGLGRDLTGRHKSGTEIPVEIGLSPVESDTGNLTLAVVTDISERKRLELNLKQANAHLEEFTYVASHDLKSPLRGIGNLVEWIQEDLGENLPEPVQKNIERIRVRIDRMENLIEDLLLYARAGKRGKESMLVDVDELITGIIEMHPVPAHFRIEMKIQIKQITAAKIPLETVLRNLFSNALKHHSGVDPCITISAEASGSYCLFKVTDNGPGIPKNAQERVFRLFQTLGHDTSSGIGLALAKRLTESHGGQIELISTPDFPGCSFHVWWPRFARKDFDEQSI